MNPPWWALIEGIKSNFEIIVLILARDLTCGCIYYKKKTAVKRKLSSSKLEIFLLEYPILGLSIKMYNTWLKTENCKIEVRHVQNKIGQSAKWQIYGKWERIRASGSNSFLTGKTQENGKKAMTKEILEENSFWLKGRHLCF